MRYDLPEFDLDGYLPYRLSVAASDLSKGLAREYRSRFDISIAEWRVLVNVGYSDQVSVRDIEQRVSMEKSKVSRAASRLEASGYLLKIVDQGDRRLLKLELTPKGAALLAEIVPIAKAYQSRVQALLGKDYTRLQQALTVLLDAQGV
jgi:DNA-binding MarR family transcriptional regulator